MDSKKELEGEQNNFNIKEKKYNKINSKYILEQIFENLTKKKL